MYISVIACMDMKVLRCPRMTQQLLTSPESLELVLDYI
jgi:hypothetical protein